MDDVVLAETDHKLSQRQLDITNDASLKFHIEYGKAKTIYLKTGKEKVSLKPGDKELEKN